jgi:uncharacterized protein (TIGR03435 family)
MLPSAHSNLCDEYLLAQPTPATERLAQTVRSQVAMGRHPHRAVAVLKWPRYILQEKPGMLTSRPVPLVCFATLLLTSTLTPAQTSAKHPENAATTQPSPATAHYSFEVVSIRPSPPDSRLSYGGTPDGFRATGMTLEWVILLTHFPFGLWSSARLQNAPGWASRDRYDLKAWSSQSLAEPTVMRAMLYSMLVDRCHLEMHTVPTETSGFALAVSHRGATLRASTPGETVAGGMGLSDGGVAIPEKLDDGTWTWHFHNASIASLTNFMSFQAHTRIRDQTGLTNRYDFALAMASDAAPNDGEVKDPATIWDLRALGLRTVQTKVPTVILVIDHIDPPSEN